MMEVTKWVTNKGTLCDTPEAAEQIEILEDLKSTIESLGIYWRDAGSDEVATALYEAGYKIVLR